MPTTTQPIAPKSWWILGITSVSIFMVSLESTIIALAFTDLGEAFPESSRSALSWVFTSYNIGVASLLLLAGWLADRYGRKRLFLGGLLIFGLGSVGSGAAQSTEMLLAFRGLQSIGGAMLYPSSLALLLPAFPIERRQLAIGIWGAMGGLAAALGPSLGALLVEAFGWRSVFLVNVPIAAGVLVLAFKKLEESTSDRVADRVDILGVPLASLGVGSLILGIVQVREWGWADAKTVASFALAVVLVAAFVRRASTHPAPLFDLKLLTHRSYTVGNIGALFFVTAFFGWLALMPSFMQGVWGWSVLKTGFAIAPGPALTALLSPVAGKMSDKYGHKPILLIGAASGVMAMVIVATQYQIESDYLGAVVPSMFFMGIAAGFSFAPLVGASMRDVPPDQFGMGGAGRTTIFNLGVALGIAMAIAIVGSPSSAEATLAGFRNSWWLGAFLYGGMFVTFLIWFPNRTSAQTAAAQRSVE